MYTHTRSVGNNFAKKGPKIAACGIVLSSSGAPRASPIARAYLIVLSNSLIAMCTMTSP
jgi:hypothetical protein